MPQNWKTYKASDFIEINPKVPLKKGSEYSFVEMKDLDSSNKYVRPSSFKELKSGSRFQNGDTLFARITPCLENGKICQVKELENNKGFGSTEFLVFRGIPEMSDSDFVFYLSRTPIFCHFAESKMIGTSGRQRVTWEAFNNLELKFPPLPEQQAIAEILSSLDDKIELNLQMNRTLEEMAMTLYKHWFVDFGPFKSPLQGGAWKAGGVSAKDENTPCFGSGTFIDSELGLIPEGWEVKGFLEVANLLSGGTPKTSAAEYWNGDICWVSAKDIGNGSVFINETEKYVTPLGVEKSSTKILPEDTVILVARGSVGKYGMIAKEMAMNQSCYGLYSCSEYSQAMVFLMFSNMINEFQRAAYGSVFDTITTSTFKVSKIVKPPVDVIGTLRRKIDPLFYQLKQNILENQTLTTLRDTLLPKLISGAVRVKDVEQTVAEVL